MSQGTRKTGGNKNYFMKVFWCRGIFFFTNFDFKGFVKMNFIMSKNIQLIEKDIQQNRFESRVNLKPRPMRQRGS